MSSAGRRCKCVRRMIAIPQVTAVVRYSHAFLDLHYATSSVEASLSMTADVIARVESFD